MRFASGPYFGKVTLRRLVVPITAVATIAAVVIGAYYAFAPRTQAASAPDYSGRAGLIPQAGSATPSQNNAAASSASARKVIKGPTRPIPSNSVTLNCIPLSRASRRKGSADDQHAGALLTNFDGVGSRDSGVSNFGAVRAARSRAVRGQWLRGRTGKLGLLHLPYQRPPCRGSFQRQRPLQ